MDGVSYVVQPGRKREGSRAAGSAAGFVTDPTRNGLPLGFYSLVFLMQDKEGLGSGFDTLSSDYYFAHISTRRQFEHEISHD